MISDKVICYSYQRRRRRRLNEMFDCFSLPAVNVSDPITVVFMAFNATQIQDQMSIDEEMYMLSLLSSDDDDEKKKNGSRIAIRETVRLYFLAANQLKTYSMCMHKYKRRAVYMLIVVVWSDLSILPGGSSLVVIFFWSLMVVDDSSAMNRVDEV